MNEGMKMYKFVLSCNYTYTSIYTGTGQKLQQILSGFSLYVNFSFFSLLKYLFPQ